MTNFIKRAVTAIIFAMVFIGGVYFHKFSFLALFSILTLFCLWEFLLLLEKHGEDHLKRPPFVKYIGTALGGIVFIVGTMIAWGILPGFVTYIIIPVLLLFFLLELYQENPNPFTNISFNILSVIYIVIPFLLLSIISFKSGKYDSELVLGILFLIWTNDTMAYIIGSQIGKHKLHKRISPNKTWEGTIGGTLCCIVVAWIISGFFAQLTIENWLIIGLIVAIFGTYGDLIESMLKRSFDVKDSGSKLPGHGGVLDRFDGLLFAVPFIYIYLFIIVR